jgi:hypothetical protein
VCYLGYAQRTEYRNIRDKTVEELTASDEIKNSQTFWGCRNFLRVVKCSPFPPQLFKCESEHGGICGEIDIRHSSVISRKTLSFIKQMTKVNVKSPAVKVPRIVYFPPKVSDDNSAYQNPLPSLNLSSSLGRALSPWAPYESADFAQGTAFGSFENSVILSILSIYRILHILLPVT